MNRAIQTLAKPARIVRTMRDNPNLWVFGLQLVLAAFVSFREYPVTQDGPAHLYGVHVLRVLASGAAERFRPYFVANLSPVGNSLFTYFALVVAEVAREDWAVRLWWFLALVALPLSAVAFERAMRFGRGSTAMQQPSLALPLACVLAYNYSFYRGLFNYVMGVPLTMVCLAAVTASGSPSATRPRVTIYGAVALACALLATLAHQAAVGFLLVAIPAACLAPGARRRAVGAVTWILLASRVFASRIDSARPSAIEFVDPLTALSQFVRAIGITYSWLELLSASAVLLACGLGVYRSLAGPNRVARSAAARFPLWLAGCMSVSFFCVPFAFGGLAGLNERIPLFVVLVLLPYTAIARHRAAWVPAVFAAFSIYTAVQSVRVNRIANVVRGSSVAQAIPKGSRVGLVSLRVKNGVVSADLGRHLLGDLARTADLVSGDLFCDHPRHVVRCTVLAPEVPILDGVQDFEHQNPEQRRRALATPESSIRRSLASMRKVAQRHEYLLVLHAPDLDLAFEEYVREPVHAELLAGAGETVRAYRVPVK